MPPRPPATVVVEGQVRVSYAEPDFPLVTDGTYTFELTFPFESRPASRNYTSFLEGPFGFRAWAEGAAGGEPFVAARVGEMFISDEVAGFRHAILIDHDFIWNGYECTVSVELLGEVFDDNRGPLDYGCGTLPDWVGGTSIIISMSSRLVGSGSDLGGLCPGAPEPLACLEELFPCVGPAGGGTWRNKGERMSAVVHAARELQRDGRITEAERDEIVSAAAASDCGR